jgi:hypothetical protein
MGMNKEKLGQEPAFPIEEMQKNVNDSGVSQMVPHLGISKRFYTACMIAQGIMSNMKLLEGNVIEAAKHSIETEEHVAKMAFVIADALLKEESK